MGVDEITYKEKRQQWLEALRSDDRHAIVNQLLRMTWDVAAFRVVNEARRFAPPAPEGDSQLNGLMHKLLDKCFFTTHMTAVRRLTDTYSLEGPRGVYSLIGILEDMKTNVNLFTRKSIFEAEGLEYDYTTIKQKAYEYAKERMDAGENTYFIPKELDRHNHERRHQYIDRLSGVKPENRCPEDTIFEVIFTNLIQKVEALSQEVKEHVDKFIAHAATPESRSIVNADEVTLTLTHLWQAHQVFCEVTGFLAIVILGDSCPGFLAIPQYDQFKYIDQPLIESSKIQELQNLWNEFDQDCNKWSRWTLNDYEKEFPGQNDDTALPAGQGMKEDVKSHPAFGMWADRKDLSDVKQTVRDIRKGKEL